VSTFLAVAGVVLVETVQPATFFETVINRESEALSLIRYRSSGKTQRQGGRQAYSTLLQSLSWIGLTGAIFGDNFLFDSGSADQFWAQAIAVAQVVWALSNLLQPLQKKMPAQGGSACAHLIGHGLKLGDDFGGQI
jgi:hypothetical protein